MRRFPDLALVNRRASAAFDVDTRVNARANVGMVALAGEIDLPSLLGRIVRPPRRGDQP
jgi:hypothetical protein